MDDQSARAVTVINPDRPRVGRVTASHYDFGGCGIGFLAYQRNRLDGETVVGVKTCLRVVVLRRLDPDTTGRPRYGSTEDPQTSITLEVDGDALLGVHAVLVGQRGEFSYHVPRRGRQPKHLVVRYQPKQSKGLFYLSLAEAERGIYGRFGAAASWGFQMVIASVLQLEYPSLPADLLQRSHLRTALLLGEKEKNP